MAENGAMINIKKLQFLSPEQMRNIFDNFRERENDNLMVGMPGFGACNAPVLLFP